MTKQKSKKPKIINLVLSTSEVAAFFGVSRVSVHKWHKNGLPKIKHGTFDLKIVFDWWWDNIAQYHTAELTDGSMDTARREYWQAKAESERIKVDQLKDTLVAWIEIEKEWCARVVVVTSGLNAFSDRLPPLLEGKSRPQMQKIIKDEVWQLRDSYARKGKYTTENKKKKSKKKRKRKNV